jgi:hypothetical protein
MNKDNVECKKYIIRIIIGAIGNISKFFRKYANNINEIKGLNKAAILPLHSTAHSTDVKVLYIERAK